MTRTIRFLSLAALGTLILASALPAQGPVPKLQDLIGKGGGAVEYLVESRGFTHVRTEKTDDDSTAYWRETATNRCVAIRTSDGTYRSIVYVPDTDCKASSVPPAADPDDGSFETVCGVEVDGKKYRYRCRLRNIGCDGSGKCNTRVTMPDNAYTIFWGQGDAMKVKFDGMEPLASKAEFVDGQTRFELEDKTYFLYRNPDRAKKELARLPN